MGILTVEPKVRERIKIPEGKQIIKPSVSIKIVLFIACAYLLT